MRRTLSPPASLAAITPFLPPAATRADEIVVDASYTEFGSIFTHLETFTIPTGQFVVGARVTGTYSASGDSGAGHAAPSSITLGYSIDDFRVPVAVFPEDGSYGGSFSYNFPSRRKPSRASRTGK